MSSQKLTRKEKIAQQKTTQAPLKELNKKESQTTKTRFILAVLMALAGFLFYSNTLQHDFVLDDYGLIKNNSSTRKGLDGVVEIFKTSYRYGMNTADYVLYRPLSKAMFAIEWHFAPDDPSLGHHVNVILFALTCFLMFNFLAKIFKGNLLIPFITTLLFAVHPIHTEVVANIKSHDEIVAFLLMIMSMNAFYNYAEQKRTKYLIIGSLLYFVSLFSKESTITFVAVIPLFYYVFTSAKRSQYISTLVPMFLLSLVYLGIRKSVLGDHGEIPIPVADNSLVAIDGFIAQRLNAIAIVGRYLKLFVYPSPLMADASFNQIPPLPLTSWQIWLPFVILVSAFAYAIMNIRKKDSIAFAILFFFITFSITSNVIMLIGTNYAERLLYTPSFGIFLAVGIFLNRLFQTADSSSFAGSIGDFFKSSIKPVILVIAITLALAPVTFARNQDWHSDATLYNTDAKKAPNSAHMLFYLANHLSSDAYIETIKDSVERRKVEDRAIDILTRAIEIYPQYADALQRRGYIFNSHGKRDLAEKDYVEALKHNPSHPIVYNNLGYMYFNMGKYNEAKENFEKSIRFSSTYAHPLNNLASVYGVFGESEKMMIQKDPANAAQHAAQAKAHFETAISYFQKAIKADKEFGEPYRLMAVTYRNLGDPATAAKYDELAKKYKGKGGQAN